MIKQTIFKTLLFATSIAFVTGSFSEPSVAQTGPCKNPQHFKVFITVEKVGEEVKTSVNPYTLVIPKPTPPGRRGDAKLIFICLKGDVEFRGQSIHWKPNPQNPPAAQFGFAKKPNGDQRKGPKFIVLTNNNSKEALYEYVALVNIIETDGTKIPLEIDPRVENKGGGHN